MGETLLKKRFPIPLRKTFKTTLLCIFHNSVVSFRIYLTIPLRRVQHLPHIIPRLGNRYLLSYKSSITIDHPRLLKPVPDPPDPGVIRRERLLVKPELPAQIRQKK